MTMPQWIRPWEHMPPVPPTGWATLSLSVEGGAFMDSTGLAVIVSAARELDGKRWLHVSCSRAERIPSWDDLTVVKRLFVGLHRTAYQVLPPVAKHVNVHPYCLHLWCCLDGEVTPDFTHGTGHI